MRVNSLEFKTILKHCIASTTFYMENINTVFLFGIQVDEPIVTLTDLLVSVLCFVFAYKIYKRGRPEKYSGTSRSIFL